MYSVHSLSGYNKSLLGIGVCKVHMYANVYRILKTSCLEPALVHEEVIFNTLVSKLLGHIEAHGAVLVIDLPLGLVVEDGVGIVDFLKLLSCLGVVWVLVRVMPQC